MAVRTVVLGWDGQALELAADDASALHAQHMIRVSFTTAWTSPELRDATVCWPHKRLLGAPMENATQRQFEQAFVAITRMCPRARPLRV